MLLKTITKKIIKKRKYIDWEEYNNRISMLEILWWQQDTRKKSLKNTSYL